MKLEMYHFRMEINKMNKILTILLLISIALISCTEKKPLTLKDFIAIDNIEKITITNSSGTFKLTPSQLEKFKEEIAPMVYTPDLAVKVGAISITVTINGVDYLLSTVTDGTYLEVFYDIVTKNKDKIEEVTWLYFDTNGVNFDNYQEDKK